MYSDHPSEFDELYDEFRLHSDKMLRYGGSSRLPMVSSKSSSSTAEREIVELFYGDHIDDYENARLVDQLESEDEHSTGTHGTDSDDNIKTSNTTPDSIISQSLTDDHSQTHIQTHIQTSNKSHNKSHTKKLESFLKN